MYVVILTMVFGMNCATELTELYISTIHRQTEILDAFSTFDQRLV